MKCSTCKEREPRRGQRTCSACHAAAQVKYREHADRKRERAAHFRGFEDGVAACIKYLRENVRDRAWTGYQTARMIEKSVTSAPNPEILLRQAMLNQMRPL